MVLAFNFMSKTPEDNKPKEDPQKEINFPEEDKFPKEEFVPYEPDFFVNTDPIIEDYIAEQPSEQPLAQPEPVPVITIPQPRGKEDLKELKRREIDKERNESLEKKKLK